MGRRPEKELRRGWTTGACAAAAARAAYEALLGGKFPDPVGITLPGAHFGGGGPSFPLAERELAAGHAIAGVTKDAGDDPDVTHGALVRARVAPAPAGSGIAFRAGEGVGRVTRPGLGLAVGAPAINPGPQAMIRQNVTEVAARFGAPADVEITIAIPGGARLAERTLNDRLGIHGGLSVLGTTGVVIPYSCSAWVHSIHRGIDVARAAGRDHLAAATGRRSEAAVKALYRLDDTALIDMGDFAGAVLKYLRRHPVARLTLAGGFAKISKLAAGRMDLHSSRSKVDFAFLGDMLVGLGASASLVARAGAARNAGEVLALAEASGVALGDAVARRAREVALSTLAGNIRADVVIIDREGRKVGHDDA